MMKQTLLKTIALGLMAMVGVNAWGQTVIYASKQINFRTNSTTEPSGWDTGTGWSTPKTSKDGLSLTSVEANTYNATIFIVEQFVIPNWSNVASIRLSQTSETGGGNMAIWLFPHDFYEADDYSSVFVNDVHDVLGAYPGSNYTNTPAIEGDVKGDLSVSNINTTCASYLSDGTMTLNLLLTSKNDASANTRIKSANTANGYNRPYLTVTYNNSVLNKTISTYYSTFEAAWSAKTDVDTEFEIYSDQILTANKGGNARTITITPKADITFTYPSSTSNLWFYINTANGVLNIGDSDHSITFDGMNKTYSNHVTERGNTSCNMNLTNVTFKNFDLNGKSLCHIKSATGPCVLDGITISNCTNATNGFIYNERVVNNQVVLKSYLNLDETSYNSSVAIGTVNNSSKDTENGAINVNDDSFTASKAPLKIKWTTNAPTAIGYGPLVTGIDGLANALSLFDIDSDSYGFFVDGDNLKLTQAYNLEVGTAKAATLVLPFATADLPASTTAYNLSYTGGDDIIASSVDAITANQPVLVTATSAGKYKYVSTATSGSAATGSGRTSANGVLIGNYDVDYVVPADNYILTKHGDAVGFRKADGSTNKVQPYRAYLTASYSADPAAREFLGIDFDGDVTAINAVEKKTVTDNGEVYNLQGVRMTGGNLPKGIYVKNGKKFVIK